MSHPLPFRAVCTIVCVAATLSACGPEPTPVPPDIPYDSSPGAVLVRIRTESPALPVEYQRNALPTCTLYGNGRVVWANPLQGGGEQLLEGVISAEKMQKFFHFIIDKGFFIWVNQVSDSVLPPEGVSTYTTITVNLAGATHAVSAYDSGALHGFDDIINRCLELVTEPTLIEPDAGWLTAFAAQPGGDRPYQCWPPDAPVSLAEAAAAGQVWLEGPYATFAWATLHESEGVPLFLEGGVCGTEGGLGQLYAVIFEVPDISPMAPPRPAP